MRPGRDPGGPPGWREARPRHPATPSPEDFRSATAAMRALTSMGRRRSP